MYVYVRSFSFKRGEVWRFPVLDHDKPRMVEVRAITYIVPLPRPRYFISAAGILPHFPIISSRQVLMTKQPSSPHMRLVLSQGCLHAFICGSGFIPFIL